MNVYEIKPIQDLLTGNSYVGRGLVVGKSEDGKNAVTAYFIMGRSQNSRNRIFVYEDGVLYTKPYDESKVEDPRLIIYTPQRRYENKLIVTNGDQTDTILEGLKRGIGLKESLESRDFEPDFPHLTPRISGMLTFGQRDFSYEMSLLKSADEKGSATNRYTFSFASQAGLGHFLHTYTENGNPLPSFCGEPRRVSIPNDIDTFADTLWNALDRDNRISLFVTYTSLQTGKEETRLINQNK